MRLSRLIFVAWFIAAIAVPMRLEDAAAASNVTIAVTTKGGSPVQLGAAEVGRLPIVEAEVAFMTANGEEKARYKGVLLWAALTSLGLTKPIGHHEELQQTLLVTGRDGYAIAFSFGEIAPDFGDKAIMIAIEVAGKPLTPAQGLRLIVPGDKRGARSVKDVVSIDIR